MTTLILSCGHMVEAASDDWQLGDRIRCDDTAHQRDRHVVAIQRDKEVRHDH